jgi:hypothetical protein
VRDLGQLRVGVGDCLAVLAEVAQDPRHLLFPVPTPRKEGAVIAADAVRHRVERLTVVVLPLGLEHVVDDLTRIGGESRRCLRTLGQPDGRQVG